jgi:hypothetical protein
MGHLRGIDTCMDRGTLAWTEGHLRRTLGQGTLVWTEGHLRGLMDVCVYQHLHLRAEGHSRYAQ